MIWFALCLPVILIAASGGACWLAWQFWKNRRQPGALWFAGCILSCGLWTLFDALSFLLTTPLLQIFARRLVWPIVVSASLCFFRFACTYAQRARWWRALRVPVTAAIIGELALMVTNPYHHLFWRGADWVDLGVTRVPALVPGPAFYAVHLPLTYGLILGGVVALFAHTAGSQAFYVRRIIVLSVGMVTPLVVNLFVVSRLTRGIDLTPLALLIAFAAVSWVTLRGRLLDVMPAVRSLLFEQHRDAVIILDGDLRVVDLNPAARRLFSAESFEGRSVAALLPFWNQVQAAVRNGEGENVEVGHAARVLEMHAVRLSDSRGAPLGRMLVLHDVTEGARLIRELDAYARTVAHDLKNPLAAAAGYLELVQMVEPKLAEEPAAALARAEEICRQMAVSIDTLLCRRPQPAAPKTKEPVLPKPALPNAGVINESK